MANTLLSLLRRPLTLNIVAKVNHVGLGSIYTQEVRYLYSRGALGIDGFSQQQERTRQQLANISERFREKMAEYVSPESKNMIFTEDLKNMIHLADNDNDINLAVSMLKRYNKQNKSLRFGNYIFGPVFMRMLYVHQKPDIALECFKSEEFAGLFDQYITYQLILDLLLENQKYNDLLDVVNIIKEKQHEGSRYPKNVVVLAFAACYKMNSQESLDYALKLWSELRDIGHEPTRRAITFCAGLALKQGKPDIALEILTAARNPNYTTVRNLKVAALAEIGRLEDIIPILKSIASDDLPQGQTGTTHTFNKEVIERVKQLVASSENGELSMEFNRLVQEFERQGKILDVPLEDQLCSEIQRGFEPRQQQQQGFQQRNQFNRNFQRKPKDNRYQSRPGLAELN